MSSATSTDADAQVRLGADPSPSGDPAPRGLRRHPDQGLQPWQFFVLAALACATAVTFLARGQGPTVVILLSVLMGATALAGLAALRTVLPLVTTRENRSATIGERARATLEREKMLTLRSIKELEFDKAMGKVSEEDFREMSSRLRSRAARLMRQLDAGAGYRERIERDLAKRLAGLTKPGAKDSSQAQGSAKAAGAEVQLRACAKCSTANDPDAKFCKNCGEKL
jgi:hypothetical protein